MCILDEEGGDLLAVGRGDPGTFGPQLLHDGSPDAASRTGYKGGSSGKSHRHLLQDQKLATGSPKRSLSGVTPSPGPLGKAMWPLAICRPAFGW